MLREPAPLHQSPLALARQNSLKIKSLTPLNVLKPLLRPYLGLLVVGLMCVAGSGIAVLGLGQVFRHVIDSGIRADNQPALEQGLIILLGLVVILAVSSFGRLVVLTGLAEQVIADLRTKVLRHLLLLDLTWFETQKTGDLLSRLTADTSVLQILIGTSFPVALRNIFLTCGGIVLMAMSSLKLTFVMLASVPLILLVLMTLGPMVRNAGKNLQDRVGAVGAQLAESLTAIREIQAFTREQEHLRLFTHVNNDAVQAAWSYVRRRGTLSALIILIVFFSVAGLLWFGGQNVIDGTLSPGQLSAFVFYALLVAGSAGTLSEIYGDLQRASGALERLEAILHTAPKIRTMPRSKKPPQRVQEIQFKDVSFIYPSRPDIAALDAINITLRAGENIALVGPSGAGKSTFFDLLLRFYDPSTGAILLDGTDIRDYNPRDYRSLFALVPQDPTLFSMSIAQNIDFGTDHDMPHLIQAAEEAGAHDFITKLPRGYETLLGERGTNLSGGQAQRIALARAMLRDAEILLLDEATAHLDSATEQLVQDNLRHKRLNRTTLIIAHRLSTVQQADRILVLENGKIVADGTHQELLKDSTLYQTLASGQLKE